ncbi:YceI family protein [Rosenbergiella australiborealis]|uniref:YceI family protein n=1 Tax=Rosenbergiella australiborealis TaxID=1544696 RepID=UPI001F4D4AF8|nr:YceI family protein [Rosenbergiella australiborealis]
MFRVGVLLFTLFGGVITADAAPLSFHLADSSYVLLRWQMIGKSDYHARITGLRGSIVVDPQHDVADYLKVDMPIAQLDAHHRVLTWALKSAQFFDQAQYPNVTFTSSRIVDMGDGRYRVLGTLKIKQITRPVMLYGKRSDDSRLLSSGGYLRLSGNITLSRQAFGMGQYPALVADPINIDIVLVATTP